MEKILIEFFEKATKHRDGCELIFDIKVFTNAWLRKNHPELLTIPVSSLQLNEVNKTDFEVWKDKNILNEDNNNNFFYKDGRWLTKTQISLIYKRECSSL